MEAELENALLNKDSAKAILIIDKIMNIDDVLIGESKQNALCLASKQNLLDVVSTLLDKGVDIERCDQFGLSALHVSTMHSNLNVMKLLVASGISIDSVDGNGYTPLMHACGIGRIEVVEFLIDFGADVNYANENGFTSLMEACVEGHFSVVLLILTKTTVNINHVDKIFGKTCLHDASSGGRLDIVEILLEFGIDESIKDKNGNKAQDVALTEEIKNRISHYTTSRFILK